MVELFDTHCHIHEIVERLTPTYDKWRSDGEERTADAVVAGAHTAGVTRLILIGTSLADSKLAVRVAEQYDNIWASIGVHPHESAAHNPDEVRREFVELAKHPKVVAVGECGLDYFYEHSPKGAQIPMLEVQMSVAQQAGLPMSFHVREAYADFWPIFERYKGLSGVLHSFTDSKAHMQVAVSHGLYIGVNGIATFSKDESQRTMYSAIPIEKMVVETDAPYLTPKPFRGKVCEPKHTLLTAEYLANERGMPLEEFARITTANARTLFNV